ncbi:MAG: MFS transporter [Anaerolineales bacterium]|jgi:MFS family permease
MLRIKDLPRGVLALGFVSLFMDISSEMIHGLLPVFLVSLLGASPTTLGVIEGLGESIALVTKVFSGALSDWLGRRKPLVLAGYALGTLSKPLFALAPSAGAVLGARAVDRFGKGLRGAPRDALVADLTPAHVRGAAYGLRQSLDSLGAVIGPLLALGLMILTGDAIRTVFWLAAIPGLVAVFILVSFVRAPERLQPKSERFPIRLTEFAKLDTGYWLVLLIGVVFTLARFSEAFLLLRGEGLGLPARQVPLLLMIMSLFYALGAYPAGRLSDRIGRGGFLGAGLTTLILADLILATAGDVFQVVLGSAVWGLHLALTKGIFASLVADTAGEQLRGTAFGVFGLATGAAILSASLIAGWLWGAYGAPATFLAGAGFSTLALLGFILVHRGVGAEFGSPSR